MDLTNFVSKIQKYDNLSTPLTSTSNLIERSTHECNPSHSTKIYKAKMKPVFFMPGKLTVSIYLYSETINVVDKINIIESA